MKGALVIVSGTAGDNGFDEVKGAGHSVRRPSFVYVMTIGVLLWWSSASSSVEAGVSASIGAGLYAVYDYDGGLLRAETHTLDLPERLVFEYYPSGEVRRILEYRGDRLDGTVVGLRPDGTVRYRLRYRNGRLQGLSSYYYGNGRLRVDLQYAAGVPHGLGRYFDPDGRLTQVVIYDHGRIVEFRAFDPRGRQTALRRF